MERFYSDFAKKRSKLTSLHGCGSHRTRFAEANAGGNRGSR